MSDEHLQETLTKLGVGGTEFGDLRVVASSAPEREQNAEVYRKCNELMLDELGRQSLGPIFHVTGEMRAVSDPQHREVCRVACRKYGTPPLIFAYLPAENRAEGSAVWKWNTANWPKQTWRNHLDVFHLLADRGVVLYALATLEEMHFSLFGDSYVLLQEKHAHASHTKRVWLVESRGLRNALAPAVERCFRTSVEMPSRMFRNFAGLLSDPLHLDMLFRLRQKEEVSGDEFGRICQDFGTSMGEVTADLLSVGFLDGKPGDLRITTAGAEFLSIFE